MPLRCIKINSMMIYMYNKINKGRVEWQLLILGNQVEILIVNYQKLNITVKNIILK